MSLPRRVKAYVGVVTCLALAALVYAGYSLPVFTAGEGLALAIFLVLAFLAEVYATWIPAYGSELSSSIAIYLGALLILGWPPTLFIVGIASLAAEVLMRWDRLRAEPRRFAYVVGFNVGQLILSVTVAGAVLEAVSRSPYSLSSLPQYGLALLAFVAYAALNLSLVATVVGLSERKRFLHTFVSHVRDFNLQYLVLCVLALLLAVLYSLSVWHMLLALVPLVLVHVSFRGYQRLQTETRKTFERISSILDERDHDTAVHSSAVATLAAQIGQELDLPERELEKLDVAARVHDIGKVGVPDAILLKPGPLSPEEWTVMKRHSVLSAELIAGLEIYAPVADAVRHEHEHWDGTGYPDGLPGETIPLLSRIIAAADVYCALSVDRPYRKALNSAEAKRTITEVAGKVLDPGVVEALLRVLSRGEDKSS